eukprot:UN11384
MVANARALMQRKDPRIFFYHAVVWVCPKERIHRDGRELCRKFDRFQPGWVELFNFSR